MKKANHIIGSVARTLLAITFIFSGFVKAIDPLGTTYKIEDYLRAFGGVFTHFMVMAEVAAWCLIAFEFVLGVCLLLNIKTQWTSWLALIMMLIMTPLTLYLALTNPITDCGCFGDALVLSNWQTFGKNIVLLALVILLLAMRKHIPPTFSWQAELGFSAGAVVLVLGFMLHERLHLPMLDFRPYKVGNNLVELMEYPDDAEPDQYEVKFVYEKDGKQKVFTIDDYPKGDSTWTFVDQQTHLIKKGYEPPVHDFEFYTLDGEEQTDLILESDKVVLIVMYDINKTALSNKQNERLQQYIMQKQLDGYQVWAATGSGADDIYIFMERFEGDCVFTDEMFLQADPVTLKTIVRANPGVVELQEGVVKKKFNLRELK